MAAEVYVTGATPGFIASELLGNRAMGGGVSASVSIFTLAEKVSPSREAEAVRTVEVKPRVASATICNTVECGRIGTDSIGGLNIERSGGVELRNFSRTNGSKHMNITLADYAVAKAANDRRIALGADTTQNAATERMSYAIIGVAVIGYIIVRVLGVI